MASYKDADNFRLSGDFPALSKHPVERTSEATRNYNCYAYAAGDLDRPWACMPVLPRGVYWPPTVPRKENDAWCVVLAYATLGYEICVNGELEAGIEKIVVYVDGRDAPQHVAIQRENGLWQSKLGSEIDVTHTLESLADFDGEKSLYGVAKYFMARPRSAAASRAGIGITNQ